MAMNESDTVTLNKQRPIKSIALKQPTSTKLNTEAHINDQLSTAHRQAIGKIFGPYKK